MRRIFQLLRTALCRRENTSSAAPFWPRIYDAVTTDGSSVRIVEPEKMVHRFGTVTLLAREKEPARIDVFAKPEYRLNALKQLLGHAILETAEIPVAAIFAATLYVTKEKKQLGLSLRVREPSKDAMKIFSVQAFENSGTFGKYDLGRCVDYLSLHPDVAAVMLCADIAADDGDSHHSQIVYDAENPGQAVRVDVEAGGGFDENGRYLLGAYANPYGHDYGFDVIPGVKPGETPNYFALLASHADPQTVLDVMTRAEKNLTDEKLDRILKRIDASTEEREVLTSCLRGVKRNRDTWRRIIRINSPELYEKIEALESRETLLRAAPRAGPGKDGKSDPAP